MKNGIELNVISSDVIDLVKNLQDLANQESILEGKIRKITGKLNKLGWNMKALEEISQQGLNESAHGKFESPLAPESQSRIIPFPQLKNSYSLSDNSKLGISIRDITRMDQSNILMPFKGMPGKPLPDHITDYRPSLQRDGLILLSWDKRVDEIGERYTAYWVTSAGIPRFYASKPLGPKDFHLASPDHKSYAAEDGVEFYGQKSPEYIVFVAPELMKSNPNHAELRQGHISLLKRHGSKLDFGYKFLLKTGKIRTRRSRKNHSGNDCPAC